MMDREGFTSFLIGLGVGIGIGMLFAPRTGSETREYLKSRAGESGAYLRDQARGVVDKSREMVGRGREQVNEAMDAARQAYRETTGRETTGRETTPTPLPGEGPTA